MEKEDKEGILRQIKNGIQDVEYFQEKIQSIIEEDPSKLKVGAALRELVYDLNNIIYHFENINEHL